jgi:uncharacterized protein YigE (DUF2233 family)
MLEQVQHQKLLFACNAGMYLQDYSAQGLFIQNGKQIKPINTIPKAFGNFYWQPNGIFYVTKNGEAFVTKTTDFTANENIQIATQSGPMLMVNGNMHEGFQPQSKSYYIRNGVGILPNGKILFAISKTPITFYEFALFFKNNKCANALYLDGYVSKFYDSKDSTSNLDGDLGVMIGVGKK